MRINVPLCRVTKKTGEVQNETSTIETFIRTNYLVEFGLQSVKVHGLVNAAWLTISLIATYVISRGEIPTVGGALDAVSKGIKTTPLSPGAVKEGIAKSEAFLKENGKEVKLESPWAGIGRDKSPVGNILRVFTPVQLITISYNDFNGFASAVAPYTYAPKFDLGQPVVEKELERNLVEGLNDSIKQRRFSTSSGIGFPNPSSNLPTVRFAQPIDLSNLKILKLRIFTSSSDEARVPDSLGSKDQENINLSKIRGQDLRDRIIKLIEQNPSIANAAGLDPAELALKLKEAKIDPGEAILTDAQIEKLAKHADIVGLDGSSNKEKAFHLIQAYNSGALSIDETFKNLPVELRKSIKDNLAEVMDINRNGGIAIEFTGTDTSTLFMPIVLILLPRLRIKKKTSEFSKKTDKKPTPEEIRAKEHESILNEIADRAVVGYDVFFMRPRPPLTNDIMFNNKNIHAKELGLDYRHIAHLHGSDPDTLRRRIIEGWMLVDYANYIADQRSNSDQSKIEGLPDRASSFSELINELLPKISQRDPEAAKKLNHMGGLPNVEQSDFFVAEQLEHAKLHADALKILHDTKIKYGDQFSWEELTQLFHDATNFRGMSESGMRQKYDELQSDLLLKLEQRDNTKRFGKDKSIKRREVTESIIKLRMFREWHSRP